jgi:hypothetical protein
VTYRTRTGKYEAVIGFRGEKIFVGEFDSALEAAKARDRKARELQGEFAYLNFPQLFEEAGRIFMLRGAIVVRTRGHARLRSA